MDHDAAPPDGSDPPLSEPAQADDLQQAELQRLAAAERALRDSEAIYQSLVEALPLAVFRKDRDFRLTFGNKRFCDAIKKTPAEFVGQTDFDLFPREQAKKFRRDDVKVVDTGEVLEMLEELPAGDGSIREIHVLKGPISAANEKIVGIQGMFWDVTEQNDAMRASEARYRELFENANDLVYTADLHGLFTSINRAGEEITAYSREELIGRNMSVLIAPEHLELAREMTRRKIATHEKTTYEIEIVAKDGRQVPVEVASRLVFDKSKPVAIQGIVRDITERKRAEQQLLAAKEAADAAKDDAYAASRAKSEFVANMSHEIRTPMNGIIGMAELLTNTALSPEQREYVGMVQQSAGALLGLLNDILDFSKIEAGKLELEPIDFSLSDSVGRTVQTLASRAADKGLELACRVPPELPERVNGDPGRLRQVLVNLVGNAIKFTQHGEVVVEVESHSRTNGDLTLHFSVRDTGIGIPEKKQELIFESFSQADASTTRRFEGTGLGLAISAQLVEMMGGRIWVESQVGRGATFHFTSTFGISQDQPSTSRFQLESLANLPTLIVDDNATNLRILDEMLKSWSLAPMVADGGVAALTELQRAANENQPYRLVLLDCMMPGMDGFSLAELVQGNASLANPAMIMISSATRPGDVDRCRDLGIARHMTKPVIKSELFDAIVAALDEHVDESVAPPKTPVGDFGLQLEILLVEDGIINQRVATGFLEQAGHRVSLAMNGREAVDATANQGFDVVLMDVQMPIMDGHEATAVIRERETETGEHLTIIAMTAAAMKGDRELCLQSGMDAYVSKPIDAEELFGAIALHYRGGACGEPCDSSAPTEQTQDADCRAIVDFDVALKGIPGGVEVLRDLAGIFLEECPKLLNAIQEGVNTGDAKSARRAAHTLRSSSKIIAAEELDEITAQLEQLARDDELSSVAERLPQLREAAERVCSAITDWLKPS